MTVGTDAKVYVVDQYNPDGTFDEHKVMLGFNDMDEAKSDCLANYEKGWEDGRRIVVSATNLEDFEKWIDSSHRKDQAVCGVCRGEERDRGQCPLQMKRRQHPPTTPTMQPIPSLLPPILIRKARRAMCHCFYWRTDG